MTQPPPPVPPPLPTDAAPGVGGSSSDEGGLEDFRVGRPRPPHQAKTVACPNCGARLELADERTRLAVCGSCASRIFVGLAEAQVLGQNRVRDFDFQLEIGDPFRRKGARYRVVARLACVEDGEVDDPTLQYLLYHPTRGSLWLSEYQGRWDVSWSTHVMPRQSAEGVARGDEVETADGRRWMVRETGSYELAYVDGALPWVAEVGDRTHYVEMDGRDGAGDTYETERSGDEIEFARGRSLTAEQVRQATGKESVPDPSSRPDDVVGKAAAFRWVIVTAALATLINGVLALVFTMQGQRVLRDSFQPEELSREAFSEPFDVTDDGNVLKIRLDTNLNNAWMSVDLALVRDNDWLAGRSSSGGAGFGAAATGDIELIHVDDHSIEYYHGVDGGESWSEGDRDETTFVRVPEAGTYRLLVRAVSAHGNASTASEAQHSLNVAVWDGARRAVWPVVALIVSAVVLVWQAAARHQWKTNED
ncbi:MAG: DUF4178 domain-containing protein [Thermoanaerobaculia bacterium]|nr:DUF4178 domain-containing protein [Thermoanaerobaculia bacterium]